MAKLSVTKSLPVDVVEIVRSLQNKDEYLRGALLSLEERKDIIANDLVFDLHAYFYKIDGAAIKVPLNWWEHLKHRWSPRWAIRKWPVKCRIITPRALLLDEMVPDRFTKGGVLYCFAKPEFPSRVDELEDPYDFCARGPGL